MARQTYDARLKSVLYRSMPELFRLLGLPPVDEYLTVEFPVQEKLVADLVVRLIDGRILHLELQSRNDPRMAWRCVGYWQVMAEKWPEAEIVQVVIYLGESPMTMVSRIERGRNRFEFDIYSLKDVDAEAFLGSESAPERMLAVLCKSADPRATIRRILASWKHLPEKQLAQQIADLRLLSWLRKDGVIMREEAEKMPIELEIDDEAVERDMAEMWKGFHEVRLLKKLLVRRFGPLTEETREKMRGSNKEMRDRWFDRAIDAPTLDDVFAD